MELLEAANVVHGNGDWMHGGQYDRLGCALRSYVAPVCDPTRDQISGPTTPVDDSVACGTDSWVFAVVTSLRTRARDLDAPGEQATTGALDAETEKAVGGFIVNGSTAFDAGKDYAWLGAAEVTSVSAGTNSIASVLAAVSAFRGVATGVKDADTLLHIGLGVHFDINTSIIDDEDLLEGTRIRVVTSPGYPDNLVAVTGPITVRISDDESYGVVNTGVNDKENEATRLVSVEFDPCHAVRVS